MNKRISISLIFLAGFFFLAHSIIPHHHHKENICFELSHNNNKESANCQSDNQIPEKGDNKNKPCCTVQLEIIVPLNQVKYDCSKIIAQFNQRILNNWLLSGYISSVRNPLTITCVQKIQFNPIPLLNYNQTVFAFGLRAPPIA